LDELEAKVGEDVSFKKSIELDLSNYFSESVLKPFKKDLKKLNPKKATFTLTKVEPKKDKKGKGKKKQANDSDEEEKAPKGDPFIVRIDDYENIEEEKLISDFVEAILESNKKKIKTLSLYVGADEKFPSDVNEESVSKWIEDGPGP